MRRNRFQGFVGGSPAMRELYSMIEKVASVDCNVLIQGGKRHGKGIGCQGHPLP